jgi:hypothetical protein
MQRFKRPAGFVPNGAPFSYVRLWDRCAACNWIARLEESPPVRSPLHEFGDHLKALGGGEPGDGFPLGFDP